MTLRPPIKASLKFQGIFFKKKVQGFTLGRNFFKNLFLKYKLFYKHAFYTLIEIYLYPQYISLCIKVKVKSVKLKNLRIAKH
jgi:hypothetical protein